MEAVLDISTVNLLAQPVGELTGSGGSIPEADDDPVAADEEAHPAGQGAIVIRPRRARLHSGREAAAPDHGAAPGRRRRRRRRHPRPGAGPASAQRFIEQVLEKLDLADPDAKALEAGSTRPCSSSPRPRRHRRRRATPWRTEAEFRVVDNAGDPELNGLYATMPPAQIGNFDMRILEHVVVERRGSPGDPAAAGDPPSRPGAVARDDRHRVRQQQPAPHRRLRLGPARCRPQGRGRRAAAGDRSR